MSTRLSTIASSGSISLVEVDGERHGLGAAGEVAGERDRGAELAEGARPGEHGAGDEARAGWPGRVTRRNTYHRDAPSVRAASS